MISSFQDIGLRLERYIKHHFPALPYGTLQKAFRKGLIKVNGKKALPSHLLGEEESIFFPSFFEQHTSLTNNKEETDLILSPIQKTDFDNRILYEDAEILVWNKPQNFAVQGGTGTRLHLDAYLNAFIKEGRWNEDNQPRLVHRLDRDTSGVLVLAKSREKAAYLMKAFATRTIKKLYWALVEGIPKQKSGCISVALSKKEIKGIERIVEDPNEGRHAETYYTIIDQAAQKIAWIALLPLTGRTHQLRVHMASLGTPILGDRKYGARSKLPSIPSSLLHLHAREIWIPTPQGKTLKFQAPLPSALKESFETLGFEEKEGKELSQLQN